MFNLNESKIIQLMEELIKRNGSDLHLTEETIPYFRVQGQIMPADSLPISSKTLKEEIESIIGKNKFDSFLKNKDFDCSFGLDSKLLNYWFTRKCSTITKQTKRVGFSNWSNRLRQDHYPSKWSKLDKQ